MSAEEIFSSLAAILREVAGDLEVTADTAERYYLDTRHRMPNGQALFFGGVEIRKSYVSFHLMPVYVEPALLNKISPALRKRMQGKSCFNFKAPDATLFSELADLTRHGMKSYRDRGYV